MADAKVKISSLTGASAIGDSDLIPIVQNGVTKKLEFSVIRNLISTGDFSKGTFDNSDLSSGVLTINHNRDTVDIFVFIFNPDGWLQIVPYKASDSNNILVDFGGAGSSIDAGDWTYYLIFYNSGSASQTISELVIDIGHWNITADSGVYIDHGLNFLNILSVNAFITEDTQSKCYNILSILSESGEIARGAIVWDATKVILFMPGSSWVTTYGSFNDNTINRGKILIKYLS